MVRTSITKIAIAGAAAFLVSSALAQPVAAQSADPAGERVGTENMVFPVDANAEAKGQFLRGLALLHNFEYDRAAAAFRSAQEADPGYVMAYWGEAMTYNHSLWDQQDRDAALAVLARLDPVREGRFAKTRSQREAMWLDAVETLYGDGSKEQRDLAYLAKMRALLELFPDDIDVRAFSGLAVLGSSHGGRQIPIYMKAASILEEGFITHPEHPGILHYLIHSYDDAEHAPLGMRAARSYASVAPDAGHAQHMVSHIFHAMGMWEESELANINADAVVDRQRAASGRAETFCGHYNEWLAYALMQQGKDASAIIEGCRKQAEAQIAGGPKGVLGAGPASSYTGIAMWNGIATGDWPEPLAGLGEGFLLSRFDLAYSRMLANIGNEDEVSAAVADMKDLGAQIEAAVAAEDPLNTWILPWMKRQIDQGEAVLVLSEGRAKEGLKLLRAAGEADSAVPKVYGPPPIGKPSWELLGEQLLAMDRKPEAAEAFRRALEFAPGRRASMVGLKVAEGS